MIALAKAFFILAVIIFLVVAFLRLDSLTTVLIMVGLACGFAGLGVWIHKENP